MLRAVPLLLLLVASGCTTTKFVIRDRQVAAEPARTGPLADLERRHAATAGDRSGFKLLEVNEEALRWRLALIDSAQHSLDVMTFLWWGDEAGDLVLEHTVFDSTPPTAG
ncbi:MAG: hypothetical protein ACOZQL_26270 [Myxococcota bacterium]